MYEDLVKRLRELHPEEFGDAWDFAFACQQAMHEAADAIEYLMRKLETREAALNSVAERLDNSTVAAADVLDTTEDRIG